MNSNLHLLRSRPLVIVLLFVGLLAPAFFVNTPTVSAATYSACALKIDKDKCNKEVTKKKCERLDNPTSKQQCIETITNNSKYPDVADPCKSKKRPQACHKAVVKDCKNKTGGALINCRNDTAERYAAAPKPEESNGASNASVFDSGDKNYQCGNTKDAVETKFDLGCLGEDGPPQTGPIQDLAYTLIRLLSTGVGIVIVASIVYAGIQYSSSEGNPEQTQQAKDRIRNSVIGLAIYIFAFSLVQYLVPGGLFAGIMYTDPLILVNNIGLLK